jgi:hypothetical protein
MMINNFLESNKIETDELGRVIIKDLNFLEDIAAPSAARDLSY